jgi:hypothetical protein
MNRILKLQLLLQPNRQNLTEQKTLKPKQIFDANIYKLNFEFILKTRHNPDFTKKLFDQLNL